MIFFKMFFLFFISLNLFALENHLDSLTLTKIKKLVEKEEEIASTYKKYILEKGREPSSLATLKTTTGYLPSNFSINNYFGGAIKFSANPNKLESLSITSNNDLKSNIYDYYYSNKYRTNTKAPVSTNKNDVEIVLSSKEKFIYTHKNKITTTKTDAVTASSGKYYLDENGVLHWYQSGNYKFSVDKDLIVDSSIDMRNVDKTVKTEFKEMIKDVTYSGQTILQKNINTGSADEYVGIDADTIVKQNPDITLDTRLGVIQIGQKSGGMIVNGDIYTWGNNENRITGIDIDDYTEGSSLSGNESTVVTTLIRAKIKMYDDDTTDGKNLTDFYTQNYFSSPLRPRFVDLIASVEHGTCGISTKGELYCGGVSANNIAAINTFVDTNNVSNPAEMLYRNKYFNGLTASQKASKILANNQLWLVLSSDGDIYRWGTENTYKNGFSGNGTSAFNNSLVPVEVCIKWKKKDGTCKKYKTQYIAEDINKIPEKITENVTTTKFKDISNTLAIGYRKIFALSTTDELYLWGKDTNIADMRNTSCSVTWESITFDLCKATRITKDNSNLPADLTFVSMRSGLKAITALGSNGKYYKIEQRINEKVKISEIKDGTTTLLGTTALSVDLTFNGTNDGTVIYVDSQNKLKSTYFSTSSFDNTFRDTIDSMSWKSIKVIDTNNSMCGINTDNQMYCWGVQTYSDSTTQENNTFMLPVFNTNLYDTTKDYLVAEGGTNTIPTPMTSGIWTDSSKKFVIKYPTYVGGFNYEFIFK